MSLLESIHADTPAPRLPVIGAAPPDGRKEALPGLRFLRDEVKRDSEHHAGLSANAPYLVAVWDELVHARHPVAIYRTFSPNDSRTHAVKVDVVAEHGARWVRVNTIKNARLMMEFREIDSYLASDDEDDTQPQAEFDNSILRMARKLLAAAKANPISIPTPSSSLTTTVTPQVTIRLTHLDPLAADISDPRIGETIQCLRNMGIDVQLGERSCSPLIPKSTTPMLLEPTTNINLDLSVLIALVSDISHSPLPLSEEEACTRFEPPQNYFDWKKDRVKALACQSQDTHCPLCHTESSQGDSCTWENSGQHSRALAAQAIQEMSKGILEEIYERVSAFPTSVTFWTTSEARHRCLQIVSKIGGERERLRADALLGSTLCRRTPPIPARAYICTHGVVRADNRALKSPADAYWEHSRYPAGFLPLAPVRVYPSILPIRENESLPSDSKPSFFKALEQTCTGILLHDAVPMSQISTPSSILTAEQKIPPAARTSLSKLTIHTVTSMLAGASRGHTTLTTNKSSVKAMIKAMGRAWGSGYEPEPTQEVQEAALWILEPRSLSEGMRSE